MRRIVLMALVVGLGLGSACAARAGEETDPAAQAAIRDVISRQLDAFRTENGAAAEAFASPGIRDKFPNPDAFMGMVRSAYGALIRPRSTHFDELATTPLGLVQKMTVVDTGGQVWTVAYTMTLVDGAWRISGCYVLKSDAVSA